MPLPDRNVSDEGSIQFISCAQTNCALVLKSLVNISSETKCALYDVDEKNVLSFLDSDLVDVALFEKNYVDVNHSFISVSSAGLMHHKFCVFDKSLVLLGSWNPTDRGTYYNDNYIVLADSDYLAKYYLREYELIVSKKDASFRPVNIDLSGVELVPCMTQRQNCQSIILNEIEHAQKSVSVLSFTFTDKQLANALLNASTRGVQVNIVFEKTRITRYSAIHLFENSSVKTYLDGNAYTMHEKLFVIDENTSIVGSYNPTKQAQEKNEENVLVVRDVDFAENALEEFDRVLEQASPS